MKRGAYKRGPSPAKYRDPASGVETNAGGKVKRQKIEGKMGTVIVVVVMLVCTLFQTTGRSWYGRINDAIVTIGIGLLVHNGLARHLPTGFIGESIAVPIALTSALFALFCVALVVYGLHRTVQRIGSGRAGKKA